MDDFFTAVLLCSKKVTLGKDLTEANCYAKHSCSKQNCC